MSNPALSSDIYSKRYSTDRRHVTRHTWFLNSAFDNINFDTALDRVKTRSPTAPFAYIVTPNVDHLVRLNQDEKLATLYAQAWMTVCDSRVLELMADFSDQTLNVTTGADLTESLFKSVITPDDRVTLIGGDQDLVNALKARYGVKGIRAYFPPMGLKHKPDEIAKCAEFVAANPSRFVFLCVGSPQQEMIAEACLNRGDCSGIGLCVGASLDFLSGKTARAPIWMRKVGLEWLHRLMSTPRQLWRRYLVSGPRIFTLWWKWQRNKAKLQSLALEIQKMRSAS